ncbi:LacI family transcriptional regulator [Kribbella antiqua]|uniref:LacI family transcriptional regulator n=1 Tax=Kribbella antiqua TaxID=2512217 RepID=A0A4R2IBH7_9ACTN|nr:LacI family DNA-binding transcriptional regulator [Kribbella antiqua]TCO41482.1 LacI family transcriptional regulator [Kribbella antiqua]
MPGREQIKAGRATIHDVAALAGVSRQTVSRAINDKDEIDPETKERVLQAARTLGYRPSRFARGLRRRGAVTVGLVISHLTNPYFPEVAAGVLEVAKERGWQVIVAESHGSADAEIEALDTLSHQVDAIVGYFDSGDELLAEHLTGLPLVLLERGPDQTRFGSVGIDVTDGMRQAVAHLVAQGHERIGMLDGAPADNPSLRRLAFLDQIHAHNLPVDKGWVAWSSHDVAGGEVAMAELLDAHPDLTAVVGFNDLIAVGAIRTAQQRGLRVPDDIAVIGFDGLTLGELITPTLTSVRIDKGQVGRLAVDQVARMLAGQDPPTSDGAWVRPDLVVRASA